MDVLFGIHPVEEALRAGVRQVDHVSVAREREGRREPRLERLLEQCRMAKVRVSSEPREALTRAAGTEMHQGVVAFLKKREFLQVEDLLEAPAGGGGHRFFLALDGVEDPHNLGALLRSADGAGVDGVILPERRSAPLTGIAAKSSAGASEHVKIARVTNLNRSLERLKQSHVWIIGLDERGSSDYFDFDFRQDCCLVLGSEGTGLHELVKRSCDYLLRIPMEGQVSSLNVSVAGAVVMYEALRQRARGTVAAQGESKTEGFEAADARPQRPRRGLGS